MLLLHAIVTGFLPINLMASSTMEVYAAIWPTYHGTLQD